MRGRRSGGLGGQLSVGDVWFGDGVSARTARAVLSPLSWLYGAATAVRNALYDRGLLQARRASIPVVSVGNLSVGGTGKTPFAAFVVGELRARGHRPAIVMRGYGDDERHLHARMNEGVPVVVNPDRVAGIAEAARLGADVAVLDDGFQHRRANRNLDIVLVSAEQWRSNARLLPAGPLREGVTSLARAGVIVVTQKRASDEDVFLATASIRAMPWVSARFATVSFGLGEMVSTRTGTSHGLELLAGARVVAVAGIGDPTSFFAQVSRAGARVTERSFRDHHEYTPREVASLVAESAGHKYVITTEKDAVKLGRVWPANGPELWYLSQVMRVTGGASLLSAALDTLFKRTTPIVG